jgi:hypothetical protein
MKGHQASRAEPGAWSGPRLSGIQVLILVAAVVACRLLATHSFPIYDDAFITFRYARNLAQGMGLVYNPGVAWEPVLGTTTPGYSVLLAGLHWLGLDMVFASRGVNLICDVISSLLIVRLLDRRALMSTAALLVFASFPAIARISVGGMEAALLLTLTLAAVAADRAERPTWAGLFAALCCTIRPEAVLLVMLLFALRLRSPRYLARYMLPVAAIGIAYAGVLWSVYGSPIPQSVQAKAGGNSYPFHPQRLKDVLAQAFGPSTSSRVVFPIVALGFLRAAWNPVRPLVLFSMLIVASYAASGAKTWGWYFYVPLAAWALAFGLGVDWVWSSVQAQVPRLKLRQSQLVQLPALLALTAVSCVALFTRHYPDVVTRAVYEPMRAWAEAHGISERRASIAASDIGAIGWYGGVILDTEGLVWPEAVEYEEPVDAIARHLPDYVVLVATRARVLGFMASPVFDRYRPVRRFNTVEDKSLEPVTSELPEWWEQDYLVYERVH